MGLSTKGNEVKVRAWLWTNNMRLFDTCDLVCPQELLTNKSNNYVIVTDLFYIQGGNRRHNTRGVDRYMYLVPVGGKQTFVQKITALS